MKIHHYFEAILVFLFISCEVSTNPNDYSLDDKATASIYDWRNYGEGTYVHNRGVILYRSYEYCDIHDNSIGVFVTSSQKPNFDTCKIYDNAKVNIEFFHDMVNKFFR